MSRHWSLLCVALLLASAAPIVGTAIDGRPTYDRRAVAFLFCVPATIDQACATARHEARQRAGHEPIEWCFMAYDSVWERLNEAVRRVMDATGCSKEEAQADICRAVADGVIRFRGRLKKHATGHMTSKNVLEGRGV